MGSWGWRTQHRHVEGVQCGPLWGTGKTTWAVREDGMGNAVWRVRAKEWRTQPGSWARATRQGEVMPQLTEWRSHLPLSSSRGQVKWSLLLNAWDQKCFEFRIVSDVAISANVHWGWDSTYFFFIYTISTWWQLIIYDILSHFMYETASWYEMVYFRMSGWHSNIFGFGNIKFWILSLGMLNLGHVWVCLIQYFYWGMVGRLQPKDDWQLGAKV